MTTLSWPLTGRAGELARIAGCVGEGRGILIVGPAGVGRTRLLEEACRIAAGSRPVVRLAATRAASSVPFGALAPLLAGADGHPVARIRRALDALDGAAIAVDDAHLLDDASAVVLHQAGLGGRTVVALTARAGAPVPEPITALWKDGLVERIDVPPLPDPDIVSLAGAALGGVVDPPLARALVRLAAGSPLVLRELLADALASLRRDGDVRSLGGDLVPGPRVADLFAGELAGLTAAASAALDVVAVAGSVSLGALVELAGAAAVDELMGRGILTVRSDGRRREVVVARPALAASVRVPELRRREIEARLLVSDPLRRREDHLRVARWRLDLGEEVDNPLEAARQAYRADDIDLAARLAALAPGHEAAVFLGQILDESGRHDEAEEILGVLDPGDLGDLLVPWALARSDNLFFGLGRLAEATATLDGAASSAAEPFPLVVNAAWLRLHGGDPRSALAAVSGYEEDPDSEHRVGAAIVAASALAALGRSGEAAAAAAAGERSPAEAPFPFVSRHRDFPRLVRVEALTAAGRLGLAGRIAAEGYAASLASGPTFLRARWAWAAGTVALAEGRVDLAARRFREGAALQRRLRQPVLLAASLAGLALAEAARGETDAAVDAAGEADAIEGGLFAPDVARARGWAALLAGDRGRAESHLLAAADVARSRGLGTAAAHAFSDLGRLLDPATAAAGIADLALDSPFVTLLGRFARGRAEEDPAALAAVSRDLEATGALLLAAEAAAEAAAATGDRRAEGLRLRALRLAARCEGARTPALAALGRPAPLTRREREVAALAASRLQSRDIAERLGISVRTVDNLLQRTYRKLGVSGRSELPDAL